MKLPSAVVSLAIKSLSESFGHPVLIDQYSSVGGGCINQGGKLTTSQDVFYIKWNDAQKYPGMFEAEAKGLHLLTLTEAIYIPKVIAVGEAGDNQLLILEYIESAPRVKDYWRILGERLAALHLTKGDHYGLDHDNYMGCLPQHNERKSSWIEFFIHQRLEPQLKIGLEQRSIPAQVAKDFEILYKKLPNIFVEESPCLVHGDLWGGNMIPGPQGEPCLIDPAAYYGHREIDLAMTRLFGGFEDEFYEVYRSCYPVEEGYATRWDVYNLYPLLVHVNLFGQSYLQQVRSVLKSVL